MTVSDEGGHVRNTGLLAGAGAFLVFIAGFGVMNLFWWFDRGAAAQHLPGLYDFYSATWGDGVLLPVATAALIVVLSRVPVVGKPVPRLFLAGLAGAGMLVGAAVQVVWLSDSAPRLNWTLPEPHRFTAAGWYHAAFFVGMGGALAVLLGALVHRLARHREHRSAKPLKLHGTSLTVFVLAAVGFAALVVRDGIDSPFTFAQTATWGAVVLAALGMFIAIVALARDSVAGVLVRLPAILIWAGAVTVATYVSWHYRIALFGVIALGVSVALVLGREGRRPTWATASQVVSSAFVSATCMSWSIEQWPTNLGAALMAAVVAMGACGLLLWSGFRCEVSWLDLLAVGVHLLVVACAGLYLRSSGSSASPIVLTTALAIASFLQVTVTRQLTEHRFQRLIDAEERADKSESLSAAGTVKADIAAEVRRAAKVVHREVWTWIIGTYVAGIVAVLTLTRGAVDSKGFQAGGASEWLSLRVLLIGGIVACALSVATAVLAAYLPEPKNRSPWVFLPAIAGMVGWVTLIVSAQALPHRFYYAPWPCLAGLIMGVVAYESVMSNVSRLNDAEATSPVRTAAVGLGVLSAVNSYWLLAGVASGPGTPETELRALGAVLIIIVVQLMTLVCVGRAAQIGLKLKTPYAPSFNLAQDGMLFLALIIVFGFVPLFIYRHLEPLSMQRSLEIAFALGPTLTFAGGVMVMTLANNRVHLRSKAEIAKATKDYRGMPIPALSSHIKFQNRMAVVLAATTLVGLANALQDVKSFQKLTFFGAGESETPASGKDE